MLPRLLVALGLTLVMLGGPGIGLASSLHEDVLAQTASLRGMWPTVSVPLALVDQAQLRENLLHSFADENSAEEAEISRKLLVLLGLLSPDADLYGMLAELYAENSLGYYSAIDKRLYIVSRRAVLGPRDKLLLAHEVTHALQDQHFDLTSMMAGARENSDRARAVSSLIEGDASLTMAQYARSVLTPQELHQSEAEIDDEDGTSRLEWAPLAVYQDVAFPYGEGFLFALALWQNAGFDGVNRAFIDPPSSTAQIIHPEKYVAGELPVEMELPDLRAVLGSTWGQLRSDVLGEFGFRTLLEQFSDEAVAAKGAEGWSGDRFSLLENTAGQQALVVNTVWESEAEAGEFFNLYVDSLGREGDAVGRRYGARARRIEDVPSRIVWMTPTGSLLVQKWGARVALIMAPDQETMNRLLAAVAP